MGSGAAVIRRRTPDAPLAGARLRAPLAGARLRAVLFDRDGTLVEDVPYNRDWRQVRPVPGAREALAELRSLGVPTAVVSNQSGVGRGWIRPTELAAVERRLDRLLGPFDGFFHCPHVPADGCDCRKPAPGLVVQAARALGVETSACVVVGDIGADVGAAHAAGAWSVLVPTAATRLEEIRTAPVVAGSLPAAIDMVIAAIRSETGA